MASSPTADLIRALIETVDGPVVDRDGWTSPAVIVEFPNGEFNSAHGYLYSPNGAISAVACDPWTVGPAVRAYADSHYESGEAMPRKILVQFERPVSRASRADRVARRYEMTFEDRDEERWNVTPRNFRQLREELRPRFD